MKIPKKKILVNKKEKIDAKKYIYRPQPILSYNNPYSYYNTLSFNSPLNRSSVNRSNIMPKQKFNYLLTSNDTINLKTEPDENVNQNKLSDYFKLNNKNKNDYSEKIKSYRENLNEIVNKLNESNDKYKKIINRKYDSKENTSLYNTGHDYNDYFAQTPKYLPNYYNQNELNNFDTFTYTQRKKNKVIKNCGEKTEIRNKNRFLNNDDKYYINIKKNNLTSNRLYESNDVNNTLKNLNKLRNEFKKISSNYLEVSQQFDTINNSARDNDISYEEIIKNNSKLNDILNYNYKPNNDKENEKVFILMKLRLKNAQIMINQLEKDVNKNLSIYNKANNVAKINNILENENKNLKIENEQLRSNINMIKEELEEYKNKFNNLNQFNKKIQETNKKLTEENNGLKNNNDKNIKVTYEDKYKELKEKYKYISEENKNTKILLQDIQSKYKILQEIHIELKQNLDNKNNNEIKILNNEIDSLNKKCKNYEKQILELKNIENKYNKIKNTNKNLNKEKNDIEKKYQEMIKNKGEEKNIKIKETFDELYKKFVSQKIKENKLKMVVGIYLQKQNKDFNQKIKEYKDKNKKLTKSIKKLNDQIIEYKLNKLNNSDKKETDQNI